MAVAPTGPVRLDVAYPDSLSRWILLAKLFLGWLYLLPHFIIIYVLSFVALVVYVIVFIAILATGRYPRPLFDFIVGYSRWSLRLDAYTNLMTDKYPLFTFSGDNDYPATLEVDYPESSDRVQALLRFLLGWLYIIIPHGIALIVYGILASFVLIYAFFSILITQRFPAGAFGFVTGLMRWSARVQFYYTFIGDKYPPFNGRP